MIFHPTSEVYSTPERFGQEYEEFKVKMPSGPELNAWYVPGREESSEGTVIIFAGLGANMTGMTQRIDLFHQLGLSVMTIDYPGYGISEGKPSEAGFYEAAEAAWRHLVNIRKVPPDNIVIYGFSLGGGVAAWLAARHQSQALILDSTFTCLADVPSLRHPAWEFVFRHMLKGDFDTRARLKEIRSPLLVLHSNEDNVVPYILGQELYAIYQNGPKYMATGRGSHDDFRLSGDIYRPALEKFLYRPDILQATPDHAGRDMTLIHP